MSQLKANIADTRAALREVGRPLATVQNRQRDGRLDTFDVYATRQGLVALWTVLDKKHDPVTFEVFRTMGRDNKMETLLAEIAAMGKD